MEKPILTAAPAIITAREFCTGMEAIWGEDPHKQYDDWHNAVKVLDAIGAKAIGSRFFDGEPATTYHLPAGERVLVTCMGAAVRVMAADELPCAVRLRPATAVMLERWVSPGKRMDDSQAERLDGGWVGVPVDHEIIAAIEAQRRPGETDNDVIVRLMKRPPPAA